ncbi:T9SS type A sorting domain-containing protein [Longitalea arenae]|uniref:T9SS type A sorting domain-containing protein n=1 Tax=Longitalea arenae TaxID=2812558 RepID=UPI0019680E61|nr:T9SS type A sorting domain-containing protein [Longitalea arenae]
MIKKLHFAYIVGVWGLFLLSHNATLAQGTTLTAGDIVVLGFNADETGPNQRWAFMTMVDLAANTKINFTDAGYDGTTGAFRVATANEGHMQWTTPSMILRGTIIYATNTMINGSTANVSGQVGGTSAYLSPGGDQIIVYQGTLGTAAGATFIYAMNTGQSGSYPTDGSWMTSGSTIADYLSWLPPGLNSSTTATLTSNMLNTADGTGTLGSPNYGFDNMYYGGTTTGSKATLLTALSNPANWVGSDATVFNLSSGGVFPSTFTILPVTLSHFDAQLQAGETVQLRWETLLEDNNDHFTIERSPDGIHYTVIATLPGKSDHNSPTNYTYTDHSPEQGNNFYRLSQTDLDGKRSILGVREVSIQNISLRLGPNPAVQFIDVAFNRGDWTEIKLYNSADQLLQKLSLRESASRIRISLQNYRPGTYFLAFIGSNGKAHTVRRFLKRE